MARNPPLMGLLVSVLGSISHCEQGFPQLGLAVSLEQSEAQKAQHRDRLGHAGASAGLGRANLGHVCLSIPHSSSLASASHTWKGDFLPSPSSLPHPTQKQSV